jgi:imidazolonepropionase-like amidohydrolase
MRVKAFAILLFLIFSSSVAAQTIAIRAGHVVDTAKGTESSDQIILVKDGKIAEVGASVAIPQDAEIVDLSREWILPGIMDSHTHVTLDADAGKTLEQGYLEEGSPLRALSGLRTSQILLNAGITTVRDVGNEANYASIALRDAINRGWFTGPTILTSGKIIAPFGGQSRGIPPEIGPAWRFEYVDADGPEQVRQAVRQNIYYGADLIKLVADNSAYFYSVEEIRAAVEEAHRAGRAVAVHVFDDAPARNVILGGADSVEHGFNLSDDVLQMMKAHGTFLVGTDLPDSLVKEMDSSGFGFPNAHEFTAKIVDRLRRAYRLGVKMAFATDLTFEVAGKTRAEMTWEFLNSWRDAGVPAAEVLKCMTVNAAELLRIQNQRGAIETGLFADMIAVPEDPLQNIETLRRVNFVMKNGRAIRRPK